MPNVHVKGCSIEADKKTKRYVLLTADKIKGNLLFVSDWTKISTCKYLALYGIDNEEAGTIIDLVCANDMRKARKLIKQAKRIICYLRGGGEARLDDAVPDDWYDVWKEFEGFLTNRIHYQGYIEGDVKETEY